jgi:2-oxoglutarate ferredoxin oxidoreductase subunit beta
MSPENGLPMALGVIRAVEAPTYDQGVQDQVKAIQDKRPIRKLRDLLLTGEVWEM